MHSYRLPLCLALAVTVPTSARAQAPAQESSSLTYAGPAIALGAGPSPSGFYGFDVQVGITDALGLTADVQGWRSGLGGACNHLWPDSYACDVRGWAASGGVRAIFGEGNVATYVGLGAGVFVRHRVAQDERAAPMVSAGVGVLWPTAGALGVRIGLRRSWVIDRDYRDLMGTGLSYTVGVVGVWLRL